MSETARFIDADVLYGKLYPLDLVDKKLYTINAKAVADAIAKTPTADVAPRSEVAREIIADFDEELHKLAERYYEQGKIEYFTLCEVIYNLVIAKIKKKYTEPGAE